MTWTGNRGTGTSGYKAYGRDHVPGLQRVTQRGPQPRLDVLIHTGHVIAVRPRNARPPGTDQSRPSQVHTQASLPSGSASTQNAGASES